MNSKIKLYTIDLDGTLLDQRVKGKKSISQTNIQAIKNIKKQDVDVVISTGRVSDSARLIAQTILPNYLIASNGAQIFNKQGQLIFEAKMSIKQGLKILAIAQKYRLVIKPDNFYFGYGAHTLWQKRLIQKMGWKPVYWYNYPLLQERYKFIIFGSLSKRKLKRVQREINAIDGLIAVTSSKGYSVEVTSHLATKGKAASFLAQRLNLSKAAIAHIGDTMNDATTVDHVGQLIAMRNGARQLKKIATHLGPHYQRGGVAKILQGHYRKKR